MARLVLDLHKGAFPIGHISHRMDGDYKKVSRNKWVRVEGKTAPTAPEPKKKIPRPRIVSLEEPPRTEDELKEIYAAYTGRAAHAYEVAQGKSHPKVTLLNRIDKNRKKTMWAQADVENAVKYSKEQRLRQRGLNAAFESYYRYLGLKAIGDNKGAAEEYKKVKLHAVEAFPGAFWNPYMQQRRVSVAKVQAWIEGTGPAPKADGLGDPTTALDAAVKNMIAKYEQTWFVKQYKDRERKAKTYAQAGGVTAWAEAEAQKTFKGNKRAIADYVKNVVRNWNTPTSLSPKEYITAEREVVKLKPEEQIKVLSDEAVTKLIGTSVVGHAGTHWGTAEKNNRIAKGVAGLRRDEWRPLDEGMQRRPTGTYTIPSFFGYDPKLMSELRRKRSELDEPKFKKWVAGWLDGALITPVGPAPGVKGTWTDKDKEAITEMLVRWYNGEIREGIKPEEFTEAMELRAYAQAKMHTTSRKSYPEVFRGMALPPDLVKGLKVGETIDMTGCTAWSFYDEIAKRYSSSAWTRDHSEPGSIGVVLKMKRSDAFDDSISMWHPNKGRGLTTTGGRQGAFEILSDLPKIRVTKVLRSNNSVILEVEAA